ncbi:hypothetical protein QA942_39845 [Streptomyces sp. B21-106]|uniref:hypothetical protein n=1 Tax=Streptomyces sp. B21-106 TaxID=3039418 RepID=UPI002FF06EE0
MNLHLYIHPVNALIVAISLVVGYLVWRRPRVGAAASLSTPVAGDLPGGAGAALATMLILAFLFGLGDGENRVGDGKPGPVTTVRESPAGPLSSAVSP